MNDILSEAFEKEAWTVNNVVAEICDPAMLAALHNDSIERIEKAIQEYIKDLDLVRESNEMRIAECEAEIERLEADEEKALEECHAWEEKATRLAEAVGEYVNEDVGEHSSANCPLANAMELLEPRNKEESEI